MKKSILFSVLSIIISLNLFGCNFIQSPENQYEESWDLTIKEPILIEGMEEKITLNLFDESNAFITYVPTDMVAESSKSDDGESTWFYANFEENKNESAYLHVFLFSETTTEKPNLLEADGFFSEYDLNMVLVEQDDTNYPWSLEEYHSAYNSDYTAYAILGEHEGQYFVILIRYPWEYGDGFIPRANKILEHFYWTDVNEYLVN